MNRLAEIWDLPLPVHSARCAVEAASRDCKRALQPSSGAAFSLLRSMLQNYHSPIHDKTTVAMLVPVSDDDDDDESVSTVSSVEDCLSGSETSPSSPPHSVVRFAASLVTEVHYRPRTSFNDKRVLFYSDTEYKTFRREYILEKQQQSIHRRVRFTDPTSNNVIAVDRFENISELYYSEAELQGFLDDFIVSLEETKE